ncbi:MAG TPA: ATP-binding protein [Longimicrobium sp.]
MPYPPEDDSHDGPAPALASALAELLPALARLDERLRAAVAAAREEGAGAGPPLPGLFVAAEVAEALLSREPGAPLGDGGGEPLCASVPAGGRIAWLAEAFALTPLDLDLLLVALAPELDLRYERIFAFLQDDVARRRPTLDLALSLLCGDPEEKLAARARLAPSSPLVSEGLLHLVPDPSHPAPPLLAHFLRADEQVVRLVLGPAGIDPRVSAFCRVAIPPPSPDLPLPAETGEGLASLAALAWGERRPLRVLLHGPEGAPLRRVAEGLASAAGALLLAADLERAESITPELLRVLFREAWLQGAVLFVDGIAALRGREGGRDFRAFLRALAADGGVTVVADEVAWTGAVARADELPADLVSIPVPLPGFDAARAFWTRALAGAGCVLDGEEIDALAGRFRLGPDEIEAAVHAASAEAAWHSPGAAPSADDVYAAARSLAARDLGALAAKLEARYGWDDIVLPPDQMAQLREVCDQAVHRPRVYGDWGFDRKHSLGKGLNVLFSGPPGTGKTMAAEVIARELRLDLFRIDLSQVVSKYIGETEKNLSKIFERARTSSAILFFDEADALFGKRSEVKDAHDRYANIETGYLLQKMEEYDGIVILATNLRQNLDEAFLRRMHVIVEFPMPDEEHRRRIWEGAFPAQAPVGGDVDFRLLARELSMAGGNIRNIALAAAFRAAANGGVIGVPHLAHAARREFQKLGRTWSDPEWARRGRGGKP